MAFKGESDKFVGDFDWRTAPADGGTRMTYRSNGNARTRSSTFLVPLMFMMVKHKAKKDHQKLKEIFESRS